MPPNLFPLAYEAATAEAVAKMLCRSLTPRDPSLRKRGWDGE